MLYGDVFFDGSIDEIVKTPNSMALVYTYDVSRYGQVTFRDGKLVGIKEKTGSGRGFVNAGIYHFDPSILDFIEKTKESERGEFDLTDSIMMLNHVKEVKTILLE